jgi:GT2 family glycosyltransferase
MNGQFDNFEGKYACGWAPPDEVTGEYARILVKDSKGRVIAKGLACHNRPDLLSLGYNRCDFAFRILVEKMPSSGDIRIFSGDKELNKSPTKIGKGHFDGQAELNADLLSGWVCERTATQTAPKVVARVKNSAIEFQLKVQAPDQSSNSVFSPVFFSGKIPNALFGRGRQTITLFANEIAFAEITVQLTLRGFLESLHLYHCIGWLYSPEAPNRKFTVQAFNKAGEELGKGKVDISREDITSVHADAHNAGFAFPIKLKNNNIIQSEEISVRLENSDFDLFDGPFLITNRATSIKIARHLATRCHSDGQSLPPLEFEESAILQEALFQFVANQRHGDFIKLKCKDLLPTTVKQNTRMNIIIPVYKGIKITEDCVNSVIKTRNANDRIILINDGSPEAGMAPMLTQFKDVDNLTLLTNEVNIGFVGTVNRGMSEVISGHVLLLNSDTIVFPGALTELTEVLESDSSIGTTTAMSNNATLFSYPHPHYRFNELPDISWLELSKLLLNNNRGLHVDVPTGHGFCMLIRDKLFQRIGQLNVDFGRGYGEENEFCQRGLDLGYRHVAAGGAFVFHNESVSFGDEKASLLSTNLTKLQNLYPEYTPTVMDFEAREPIRKLRYAIDKIRLSAPKYANKNFVVVVQAWLGGGTETAIKNIERLVGYNKATKISIKSTQDGKVKLELEDPPIYAIYDTEDYDELLSLLDCAKLDLVLIHSLLGFTDVFAEKFTALTSKVKTIYYAHDFYPICQRITMIDAIGQFCNVANADTCGRCVAISNQHEASKFDVHPVQHRVIFENLLQKCHTVIPPSQDTANYFAKAFNGLNLQAIEHPDDLVFTDVTQRDDSGIINVALLGAISVDKGSERLYELAKYAELNHPNLFFHVIGFTNMDDKLLELSNVAITGKYTKDTIKELISESKAEIALFLHKWPETFSFTLSEALSLGLVPIVPAIGAPVERLNKINLKTVFDVNSSNFEITTLIYKVNKQINDHKKKISKECFETLKEQEKTMNIYFK